MNIPFGQKYKNAVNLYIEGIKEGRYKDAVEAYTGDQYIQHSTGVRDGKEGFIEFFEKFVKENSKRNIQIIRGWQDGQYVFLHVYQNINDGEAKWVTADFFDTDENDKIIEHWDVIAPYYPHTPSGHTSIDGETQITDLDKTEDNKNLVKNLLFDGFMSGGDPTKIVDYLDHGYIQHNHQFCDGAENFIKFAQSPNKALIYLDIVLCVGAGNFVATLSRTNWTKEGVTTEYAQVDIFRCENDKVIEHWDNIEPVPELPVNSGKF